MASEDSDFAPAPGRRVNVPALVLGAVLLVIVAGLAGFLIAHHSDGSSGGSSSSIPDPETVSCGTFANLPSSQKKTILKRLNDENDTHVSMGVLDAGCPGLIANAGDPVSGAVINLGD